MSGQINELVKLVERHTGQDGVHATAIPALFLSRQSGVTAPRHGVQRPSLCLVVQGKKTSGWHRNVLLTVLPIIL